MGGLAVCRALRRDSGVPVIMLTARLEETDRLIGLELGADDYLVKPFSPRAIVARVRAVLRRTQVTPVSPEVVSASGVTVDLITMEFDLLALLVEHSGQVFSRLQLLDRVQRAAYECYERTIDAHVKNLRRKLGPATASTGCHASWAADHPRRTMGLLIPPVEQGEYDECLAFLSSQLDQAEKNKRMRSCITRKHWTRDTVRQARINKPLCGCTARSARLSSASKQAGISQLKNLYSSIDKTSKGLFLLLYPPWRGDPPSPQVGRSSLAAKAAHYRRPQSLGDNGLK
jgi:hypothetical protein